MLVLSFCAEEIPGRFALGQRFLFGFITTTTILSDAGGGGLVQR